MSDTNTPVFTRTERLIANARRAAANDSPVVRGWKAASDADLLELVRLKNQIRTKRLTEALIAEVEAELKELGVEV